MNDKLCQKHYDENILKQKLNGILICLCEIKTVDGLNN